MRKSFPGFALPSLAVLLGVMTLAGGGSAIFQNSRDQMLSQNIIPEILYFNFVSGFVYIWAGLTALWQPGLARKISLGLLLGIGLAGVFLLIQILNGQPYLDKTVAALAFRFCFWLVFILWLLKRPNPPVPRPGPA